MKDYSALEKTVIEKFDQWNREFCIPESNEYLSLFNSSEMKDYYANTKSPELFNSMLKWFGEILNDLPAESCLYLHLIDILSQDSVKVMGERFKDDEKTKDAIAYLVEGSLNCAFSYAEDVYPEDLNKYLPIIKPWISYLSDETIVETVKNDIGYALETFIQLVEDEEFENRDGVEHYSITTTKKLDFLRDVLKKESYEGLIKDLSEEWANGLRYLESKDNTPESNLTVYMMIGIPASGKSTVREQEYGNIPVVSKDLCNGSESKERKQLEELLSEGKSVVVDDTNYNKVAREKIISIAKKYGADVIGVYVDVDKQTALERNKEREKKVPSVAIHTIAKKFEKPEIEEGFSDIIKVDK